jgi:hypothetical protein
MHDTTDNTIGLAMITIISIVLGYYAVQTIQHDTMFGSTGPAAHTVTQQVNELTKAKIYIATLGLN